MSWDALQDRLPQLIYLAMALLLVTGAGFGFARLRADKGRIVPSLLFWAGVIVLIVVLYNLFN